MGRARKHKAGSAAWEGTKISATLIDFGQPLLDELAPDAPLELRKQVVGLIVMIWNSNVMARSWGQPEYLAQARDTLMAATARGELDPQALAFFELLSARHELERFADDPRAVGLWEIRDTGPGEWTIRCDARVPPKRRPSTKDPATSA